MFNRNRSSTNLVLVLVILCLLGTCLLSQQVYGKKSKKSNRTSSKRVTFWRKELSRKESKQIARIQAQIKKDKNDIKGLTMELAEACEKNTPIIMKLISKRKNRVFKLQRGLKQKINRVIRRVKRNKLLKKRRASRRSQKKLRRILAKVKARALKVASAQKRLLEKKLAKKRANRRRSSKRSNKRRGGKRSNRRRGGRRSNKRRSNRRRGSKRSNKRRANKRRSNRRRGSRRARIIFVAFDKARFLKQLLGRKSHRFYGKRGFSKYARLVTRLKWLRAKKAARSSSSLVKKEKNVLKILKLVRGRLNKKCKKSANKGKITRIVIKGIKNRKNIKLVIPKRLKNKIKKIIVYRLKQ